MAYTIISQNNSTTTLSDGVNTITVPSRVNLTSGNFTIVEVNNNMATLEDGDGNVYRDIPCVATLAGEGGGGSVDYSKTVQKAKSLPTANASNVDQVFMYTGATDANYTTNYIYKNVKTSTYTGTVSFEAATLSSSTIACSGSDFATFVAEWGSGDITTITHGTLTYDQSGGLLVFVGKDSEETTVCTFQLYTEDYQDAGFTITGTLQDGDVVAFTCSITEASATYAWTRVDVQPAPSGLPDQTGQSGKFLTTDGTDASWSDKPLVNISTVSSSIIISKGRTSSNKSSAVSINASGEANSSVAVGASSQTTQSYGLALGCEANSFGVYSIQLGRGDNSEAKTFYVGLDYGKNYKLLDLDGTIPTARLTKVNTAITLAVADWSSNTQTVSVTGMTATGVVLVSPDPTDQADYTSAGIYCSAQAAGTLTFTCSTTPSADLSVNVVML